MLAIKSKIPSAKSIYIIPPSISELKKRLLERGLDSNEVIDKRVSVAEEELTYAKFADYVIVNDDFSLASESLKSLVLMLHIQNHHTILSI